MISAHPPTTRAQSVLGALAGKNVLLTGVTGFLGKVFLALVLEEGLFEGGRITLLVRGKKGRPSAQRLAALFARSPAFRRLRAEHGAQLGPWLSERLDVVDGEAREPGLGIDPEKRATIEARTDVVIHVAGLTDFNPDPTEAVAVNVHGALAAAALAQQTRVLSIPLPNRGCSVCPAPSKLSAPPNIRRRIEGARDASHRAPCQLGNGVRAPSSRKNAAPEICWGSAMGRQRYHDWTDVSVNDVESPNEDAVSGQLSFARRPGPGHHGCWCWRATRGRGCSRRPRRPWASDRSPLSASRRGWRPCP